MHVGRTQLASAGAAVVVGLLLTGCGESEEDQPESFGTGSAKGLSPADLPTGVDPGEWRTEEAGGYIENRNAGTLGGEKLRIWSPYGHSNGYENLDQAILGMTQLDSWEQRDTVIVKNADGRYDTFLIDASAKMTVGDHQVIRDAGAGVEAIVIGDTVFRNADKDASTLERVGDMLPFDEPDFFGEVEGTDLKNYYDSVRYPSLEHAVHATSAEGQQAIVELGSYGEARTYAVIDFWNTKLSYDESTAELDDNVVAVEVRDGELFESDTAPKPDKPRTTRPAETPDGPLEEAPVVPQPIPAD